MTFWQKYFRNELSAIELILNSGDPELLYGIPLSYCINKRRAVIANLIRLQIAEYDACQDIAGNT